MRITDAFFQSGAIRDVQKAGGAKPEKKSEGSVGPSRSSDSVTISKAARSASETDRVVAHAQALPEVRETRVAEVKARVQSGYYNTPEFRDQLAERLLKEFGVNG
jgi:anti-sigma28 factor (negative regulator of flagellin synthesis)